MCNHVVLRVRTQTKTLSEPLSMEQIFMLWTTEEHLENQQDCSGALFVSPVMQNTMFRCWYGMELVTYAYSKEHVV